jgi:hypothetical protein
MVAEQCTRIATQRAKNEVAARPWISAEIKVAGFIGKNEKARHKSEVPR